MTASGSRVGWADGDVAVASVRDAFSTSKTYVSVISGLLNFCGIIIVLTIPTEVWSKCLYSFCMDIDRRNGGNFRMVF